MQVPDVLKQLSKLKVSTMMSKASKAVAATRVPGSSWKQYTDTFSCFASSHACTKLVSKRGHLSLLMRKSMYFDVDTNGQGATESAQDAEALRVQQELAARKAE